MSSTLADPRYPIGKYEPKAFSPETLQEWINDIRYLPGNLENALLNLDASQLDTPYRDGGWTVRQLVHHVADSHMNAYIRFKWGLTEDRPTIKTYEEKSWALLHDAQVLPTNISATLLHALHARWVDLLTSLDQTQWDRTIFHPEKKQDITLWYLLGMYAWHSRHHVAHITAAKEKYAWN